MNFAKLPSLDQRPAPGARLTLRRAGIALWLGLAATGALAQYRIVGPDGSVTYTDRPPTGSDLRTTGSGGNAGADTGAGGLPYETRQASARYPVTFYATKNCDACDQARQWLRSHGLPFNEYSVSSNDDIAALQQRFSTNNLPIVTFGAQAVKGFSASDYQSYADAAGYPRNARLSGYSWPPARPLVPARSAPAVSETATTGSSTAPSVTLPPPSRSGIQF